LTASTLGKHPAQKAGCFIIARMPGAIRHVALKAPAAIVRRISARAGLFQGL